jgi:hypothetical protein
MKGIDPKFGTAGRVDGIVSEPWNSVQVGSHVFCHHQVFCFSEHLLFSSSGKRPWRSSFSASCRGFRVASRAKRVFDPIVQSVFIPPWETSEGVCGCAQEGAPLVIVVQETQKSNLRATARMGDQTGSFLQENEQKQRATAQMGAQTGFFLQENEPEQRAPPWVCSKAVKAVEAQVFSDLTIIVSLKTVYRASHSSNLQGC